MPQRSREEYLRRAMQSFAGIQGEETGSGSGRFEGIPLGKKADPVRLREKLQSLFGAGPDVEVTNPAFIAQGQFSDKDLRGILEERLRPDGPEIHAERFNPSDAPEIRNAPMEISDDALGLYGEDELISRGLRNLEENNTMAGSGVRGAEVRSASGIDQLASPELDEKLKKKGEEGGIGGFFSKLLLKMGS